MLVQPYLQCAYLQKRSKAETHVVMHIEFILNVATVLVSASISSTGYYILFPRFPDMERALEGPHLIEMLLTCFKRTCRGPVSFADLLLCAITNKQNYIVCACTGTVSGLQRPGTYQETEGDTCFAIGSPSIVEMISNLAPRE